MFRFVFVGAAMIGAAALAAGCTLDQGGLSPLDGGRTDVGPPLATDLPGEMACGACGPCQRCGAGGACEIDPASAWQIVCVSASVAASPPGRDRWDPPTPTSASAAPDPYCQFVATTVASQAGADNSGITTTIADSFTPSWNQVVTPPGRTISAAALLDPNATWKLIIGDDDGCTPDQGCIAETICTLSPPFDAASLADGQFSMPVAPSCEALTLRLVCQP